MKKVIVILLSVMIVGVSGCGEKLEEKQVTTKIITEEMPESTITEEISSTTELVNKAELKPVKKDNKIETGGTLENKNVETEMPRQDQDIKADYLQIQKKSYLYTKKEILPAQSLKYMLQRIFIRQTCSLTKMATAQNIILPVTLLQL